MLYFFDEIILFRKQVEGNAPIRSGSFATPSFFNERIYELHDNSGSVMNTPTFYPPTNRGEDYFNTSRSMHQVSFSLVENRQVENYNIEFLRFR